MCNKIQISGFCQVITIKFLESTICENMLLLSLALMDITLGIKSLIKGKIVNFDLEEWYILC